jgi:hypothetical protein
MDMCAHAHMCTRTHTHTHTQNPPGEDHKNHTLLGSPPIYHESVDLSMDKALSVKETKI